MHGLRLSTQQQSSTRMSINCLLCCFDLSCLASAHALAPALPHVLWRKGDIGSSNGERERARKGEIDEGRNGGSEHGSKGEHEKGTKGKRTIVLLVVVMLFLFVCVSVLLLFLSLFCSLCVHLSDCLQLSLVCLFFM